jgi:hypothetical protein
MRNTSKARKQNTKTKPHKISPAGEIRRAALLSNMFHFPFVGLLQNVASIVILRKMEQIHTNLRNEVEGSTSPTRQNGFLDSWHRLFAQNNMHFGLLNLFYPW